MEGGAEREFADDDRDVDLHDDDDDRDENLDDEERDVLDILLTHNENMF